MEEPSSSRQVNKIQTFVFVDIESTGLAMHDPRMVELSLIAVSRDDLVQMSQKEHTNVNKEPADMNEEATNSPSPDMFQSPSTSGVVSGQISADLVLKSSHASTNGLSTPSKLNSQQENLDQSTPSKLNSLQGNSGLSTPSKWSPPQGKLGQYTPSKWSPHQGKSGPYTPSKWSPPPSPPRGKSVPKLPRVLHKYTRLYYPWKLITPAAEEMTGLSNYLLEKLQGFNQASAQAIHLFLDLPKPITLVAHNGSRFDFRLLKAEVSSVDCSEDFNELLCTDTLKAIKDIDALCEKEDIQQMIALAESFSFDDIMDDDDDSPPPPIAKRTRPEESVEARPSVYGQVNNCTPHGHHNHHQPILEASGELPITPIKEHPLTSAKTPATPHKPSRPQPSPVTPEVGKSCPTTRLKPEISRGPSNVRRSLTYEGPGKRKFAHRMPYKQVNIYHRLFGSQYEAHRAESDCQALLEICGHYGERFVEWADTFSESFAQVKPMWVKRKSFAIN